MKKIPSHARKLPLFLLLASLLLPTITAPAQSASGTWDQRFTLPPGINGTVTAMTTYGNALYVAGFFSKAEGIPANNIAKWDGTNWSALGTGVNGQVYALAVSGSNLYVGGSFSTVGGITATNIARWNGVEWQPLGSGIDVGSVWVSSAVVGALYANGSDLYAGGRFGLAGGQPAINVAHWDGSAWHAMDTGAFLPDDSQPFGLVQAITGDGTNVYIGGSFVQAGSVGATNLARWNGTNWQAFGDCSGGRALYTYDGNQLYGSVTAMAMHQGALFVGGYFEFVAGVAASGLARWDGTNWNNVGDVTGGQIQAFQSYSNSLYLTGNFTSAGGIATTNAAIFTNGLCTPLNLDLHPFDYIFSLQHFGSQLYVGGGFNWFNGVSAGNLVRWNGTNWLALNSGIGNSLSGAVSALATDGSNIFATGYFGTAGTNLVTGLARWNGTNWSPIGSLPLSESALLGNTIAVIGSNIFVGGDFTIAEANANGIACWNGVTWNSVGGPLTNVFANQLLAVGNILYLSGSFIDASGQQFGPVSAWNGTNWTAVPWDYNPAQNVFDDATLATDQTNLYIARTFFDDDYAIQIARWDGFNLTSIGDIITNSRASALSVNGTDIYLGISQTDHNYAPALYSWNGTGWNTNGSPLADSGIVKAILPLRGNLYVAGSFASLDGTPAANIALWTGTNWLNLAGGVGIVNGDSALVQSLIALGRNIFVAGQFNQAGSFDSGNFAIWHEAPQILLTNPRKNPNTTFTFDLTGLPGDQLEIQYSTTLTNWTSLTVTNLINSTESFSDLIPSNSGPRYYRAHFLK